MDLRPLVRPSTEIVQFLSNDSPYLPLFPLIPSHPLTSALIPRYECPLSLQLTFVFFPFLPLIRSLPHSSAVFSSIPSPSSLCFPFLLDVCAFPFLELLEELQKEVVKAMTPLSRALIRFTCKTFFSPHLLFDSPSFAPSSDGNSNINSDCNSDMTSRYSVLRTTTMLFECARENDIFLFQHILDCFPYPGFSDHRNRFSAILLAATKSLSYDFIYYFVENFGEDMGESQYGKIFEAMGRMSRFDLFAKVTQYFRFEVEGQNPLAVYFLKGYFCTPNSEFSRDTAREFIAEYLPTAKPVSIGRVAAQSKIPSRIEFVEEVVGESFSDSWRETDTLYVSREFYNVDRKFLEFLIERNIRPFCLSAWLVNALFRADVELVSYILTSFGDDERLQDGDYYHCDGITVDSTNKDFLECLRLISNKVGDEKVLQHCLLDYCREHDDPRFLDLIFKMATPVTFLEQAVTHLGPSCWLWLKEKIGEEYVIGQLESLYYIPLRDKSKQSFPLALSIRPFFFQTKKFLYYYLNDLNGGDFDVEGVLFVLRAGAIAEKDMVEFYDLLLADFESPEIARYLNFHPVKT